MLRPSYASLAKAFCLLLVLSWVLPLQAQEQVGETTAAQIESPHPYPDGNVSLPIVWTCTLHHPDASFLKLHFARFALGSGDVVRILDGQGNLITEYTDAWNARQTFWAFAVEGDTLIIELRADGTGMAEGVTIDRYGYGALPLVIESICGSNQREAVACYAGTPIETASRAVGRMLFENQGVFFVCTGFLISDLDHFLSNEHCISSQASVDSLEVLFNFERDSCGGLSLKPPEVFAGDRFLGSNFGLDHALLTLKGKPSATYGFLPLSYRDPDADEPLYLPQHPGNVPKEVSVLGCQVSTPQLDGRIPDSDFGHQCDTQPGSSGSPVLDLDNQVVGLHHIGGCITGGGENLAVRMSQILPLVLPLISHDLAVTKIIAPQRTVLTDKVPTRTKLVKVQIENRSAHEETITDMAMLGNLVNLTVESLGNCDAPVPILHTGKPQKDLPLTLKPKQELNVVFAVTFTCANDPLKSTKFDPGHEDYRYVATVDHTALDGQADDHPADDFCPRSVSPPFEVDPHHPKIKDRGCGEKKPDQTFGADMLADVVVR